MNTQKQQQQPDRNTPERNTDQQGVDKAPGEEKGKAEKVTSTDLKGKKVDADPSRESDQPVKKS